MSKKRNMVQGAKTSTESVQQGPRMGMPVEWVRSLKHEHIVGHIGGGKSNCLIDLLPTTMPARNESDH